jgi:hypothetical protein
MVEALTRQGFQAVAPVLLPEWARVDSDQFVFASTWSERHAAYAAGLGTFGLCDGLITAVGKSMRVGSVVVRAVLPATPRPYASHREYCLFFNSGTCRKCIERCPASALSEKGHDKRMCKDYVHASPREYVSQAYILRATVAPVPVGRALRAGIPPRPRATVSDLGATEKKPNGGRFRRHCVVLAVSVVLIDRDNETRQQRELKCRVIRKRSSVRKGRTFPATKGGSTYEAGVLARFRRTAWISRADRARRGRARGM